MSPSVDAADGPPPRAPEFLWMPVWLAAGLHLLAWLTLGYWLYYRVPAFRQVMEDFGLELPELTVLIVNVSELVVTWWFALAPLAALLAVGDALIDLMLVRTGRYFARTAWFLAGFAAPAALLFLAIVSVDILFLSLLQHFVVVDPSALP